MLLRLVLPFLATACASTATRMPASVSASSSLPLTPPSLAQSYQGPLLVDVPGIKRSSAKVYLPLQFASQESWPLVVLLHGLGGTGETEDSYLTMRYRVSTRGFILLTPDGSPMPRGTIAPDGRDFSGKLFWNATDFCCDFGRTKVDDVTYLNRLIEIVKARYNVDPARIYIFGHSNGGFMANRLACEMGDQLAGVASLAGGTFALPEKCRDPKPARYLQIHAVDDERIDYESGLPEYAGALPTVKQWVDKNGCRKKTVAGEKDFALIVPGVDTKSETWEDCASGHSVALWTIRAFKDKNHNPHIPIFNLSFSDAVLDFLMSPAP